MSSPEVRQKISDALHQPEVNMKLRESISRFCHSDDYKRKQRARNLGEKNPMFGVELTEETKKKLGLVQRGVSKSPEHNRKVSRAKKAQWQDPEFAKMMWESWNASPNQCELKLQELLISLNLPYKFVGNGQVIMGGKSPDFINTDGQKKIIEHFGDYWHSEEITGRSIEEEIRLRIEHFLQFGFNTLIIWESELSDIETLSQKILIFENAV